MSIVHHAAYRQAHLEGLQTIYHKLSRSLSHRVYRHLVYCLHKSHPPARLPETSYTDAGDFFIR